MNNFWKRAITGLIFCAIVLASIFFLSILTLPLFCFFAVAGVLEYRKIVKAKGIKINATPIIIATILLFITPFYHFPTDFGILASIHYLLPIIILLIVPIIAIHKKKYSSFASVIHTFIPFFWVVLPLFILSLWAQYDASTVIALIFIIWASDSFAYCFGSLLGKHPLHPRISPKKSWEGFVLSAITTAFLSSFFIKIPYFQTKLFVSGSHWLLFAIIAIVFSLYGDLLESLFKRNFNVKDSGNLLPGHGGVLDRFDSFFLAVPAACLYYISLQMF